MNIINNDSIQRIMNYTDRNSVKGRLYKALGKEVVPQLSFFGQKPPLLEGLEKLEIDSLTPLEALTKLYELRKKAREG